MKQNKFGELIFSDHDVIDLVMQGHDPAIFADMIVDATVDLDRWPDWAEAVPGFQQQRIDTCSVAEWHAINQKKWHKRLDRRSRKRQADYNPNTWSGNILLPIFRHTFEYCYSFI